MHGQACHSHSGAWLEARHRYASACELPLAVSRLGRVRLLDVGTGLGLNLAAALRAVHLAGGQLEVVTLELDPAVLRAARALATGMPSEVRRWHKPVLEALSKSEARGGGRAPLMVDDQVRGDLRLSLGDASQTLASVSKETCFDAVFLDPFSPRVEPRLWQPDVLGALADRMRSGSLLSTYTASLAVRAALQHAGLRVGAGPRVGAKAQGTLASPDRDLGGLDPRTRRRIARRAARLAAQTPPSPADFPCRG